ncbi:hypothetical protein [Dyadobacter sp. OTU695]|uniref:hypothetical protein n=1 Tax=Dyadobacter sp. OTU695 TaxID=3043860 RepID=UPI00313D2043
MNQAWLPVRPARANDQWVNVQFHALKDLVIFQARKSFFSETPDTYRKWPSVRQKMPYYCKNDINELVRATVTMYAPFLTKFHWIDFATGYLKEGVNYPLIRYADKHNLFPIPTRQISRNSQIKQNNSGY